MSSPRRGTPAQQVFPGRAARGGEKSSEAADQSAAGEDVTTAISLRVTQNQLGGAGLFQGVVPSPNVCET